MKKTMLILLCCLCLGCTTTTGYLKLGKINSISLGMTKFDVIDILGNPISTSAQGNVEVLRYMQWESDYSPTEYWVHIVDGKVKSYGRAGDFGTAIPETLKLKLEYE